MSNDDKQIPHTLTRLSQSLLIVSYHQEDIAGSLLGAQALSLKPVGAAYGLRVNQSRTNTKRYGINSSMQAFATVPGAVSTELEIDQVMLYIHDAMLAFGFYTGIGNIAFQEKPLVIQEIVHLPGIDFTHLTKVQWLDSILKGIFPSGVPVTNTYVNCWIKDSKIEYKLDDNQAVMQNVSLDASWVTGLSASSLAGGVAGSALGGLYSKLASKVSTQATKWQMPK